MTGCNPRSTPPEMAYKNTLVAAVLAAACLPGHAINKCTDANGKVVLQDIPCTSGKAEVLKVRPTPASPSATQEAEERAQRMKADNALAAAVREKRPMVGMNTRQLAAAMGPATTVNTDTSAGGVREQAVYERETETWYVYVRSGVVEHVQHRPLPPEQRPHGPHAPHGSHNNFKAANGRCPLSNEMRDAEIAADSLTNAPDQRAALQRKLRDMKACK